MSYVKSIGSRRELFVDDWLIESMNNMKLKLHSPVRREVVLDKDNFGYATVFKDNDLYRMYYRTGGELYNITKLKTKEEYMSRVRSSPEVTAYAESKDGVHWERPELGLIEFKGSKANNIVWDAAGLRKDTSHNFTPFKDSNPAAGDEMRYKALGGKGKNGLKAFASPDAIHWCQIRKEPVITDGAFDSQNLAFWDELRGQYVAFFRAFRFFTPISNGFRSIKRCTSQDFLHWSKPEWVDFGDTPIEQLYTNAAIPYFRAPHIYLAFPRRFVPGRKVLDGSPLNAISDQVFMTSRDGGIHWNRRFMEAFLRQGPEKENWTDRNGTISWGVVPTGEHEISLYWCDHRKMPTCRMRRGTLRTDGFVSVNAPYTGGELITKPLWFEGQRLLLNYATSAVGSVKVEVQDEEGHPIEGFELNEEMYGDEIDGEVRWKAGKDLSELADRPVRLRFVMKDADVYAFKFSPGPTNNP